MRIIIIGIILLGCISCHKQQELAKVRIEKKNYDFGKISIKDSLHYSFTLINNSETPLLISKVGTSCGCTTTDYTKVPIQKDEKASVNVLFKPYELGYIEKSIVVESNTDPPFHVFYIKGNVVE